MGERPEEPKENLAGSSPEIPLLPGEVREIAHRADQVARGLRGFSTVDLPFTRVSESSATAEE